MLPEGVGLAVGAVTVGVPGLGAEVGLSGMLPGGVGLAVGAVTVGVPGLGAGVGLSGTPPEGVGLAVGACTVGLETALGAGETDGLEVNCLGCSVEMSFGGGIFASRDELCSFKLDDASNAALAFEA
jgi:hypothetical protein